MRIIAALTGALLGLVPASTAATISNGTFGFSGTFLITGTGGVITPAGVCPVGITCVFWQNPTMLNNNRVDIDPAGLPNGDIPLAIAGMDAAGISSVFFPPAVVGGAGFPASQFMVFFNAGITTILDINFIAAGIYSSAACNALPAAGQTCTVAGSFINLQNITNTSSIATWSFSGVTNDGLSSWTATFSSQFSTSYQAVLSTFTSNGFVAVPFTGGGITSLAGSTGGTSITLTPIPEPGTIPLVAGTGLMGLLFYLRCRDRRKSIRH